MASLQRCCGLTRRREVSFCPFTVTDRVNAAILLSRIELVGLGLVLGLELGLVFNHMMPCKCSICRSCVHSEPEENVAVYFLTITSANLNRSL